MSMIDINCDMGEGIGDDEAIMPFITSANIACGYHAGDESTIRDTLILARKNKVAAGAHVSFRDRENFGRKEIQLPHGEVYAIINEQLSIIKRIADQEGVPLVHVKPHGAMYNMSARDRMLAMMIAKAVKDFDEKLVLFGLSASHSVHEAELMGMKVRHEVFADRTYQEDGSLTPRTMENSMIEDEKEAARRVLQMVKEGTVITTSGKKIFITADTVCLHSDGSNAVKMAREIYNELYK